jgi:hypothetical protein
MPKAGLLCFAISCWVPPKQARKLFSSRQAEESLPVFSSREFAIYYSTSCRPQPFAEYLSAEESAPPRQNIL